jgi:hypothetical protein
MKIKFAFIVLVSLITLTLTINAQDVGVGINTDGAMPHPSAILDVSSTQHGLLIPRMTSTQKDNITEAAEGLMIYQTDGSKGYYYFTGTLWERILDESSQSNPVQGQAGETLRHNGTDWIASGNLYNNGGNIGIGTTNPLSKLEIFNSEDNTNTFLNIKAASGNNQKIGITFIRHNSYLAPSRWEISRDQADSDKLKFQFYNAGLTVEPLELVTLSSLSENVGIGTINPAASALLEMNSTSKGLLIPRMTQVERDNIPQPSTSLLIYQSDQSTGFHYNAGTPASPDWVPLSSGNGLSPGTQPGEMLYWNGTAWITINPGLEGQVLTFFNGHPTWTCIVSLAAPVAGDHTPGSNRIQWSWNAVNGASGYKYNTINDFTTATNNGSSLTYLQTGLNGMQNYSLYVWSYNACGPSPSTILGARTFKAVTISTVAYPSGSCFGNNSAVTFSIKNPEEEVIYQWKDSSMSEWVTGSGINGTNWPPTGYSCCGDSNFSIYVRGVRNGIISSTLHTYSCAGGQD